MDCGIPTVTPAAVDNQSPTGTTSSITRRSSVAESTRQTFQRDGPRLPGACEAAAVNHRDGRCINSRMRHADGRSNKTVSCPSRRRRRRQANCDRRSGPQVYAPHWRRWPTGHATRSRRNPGCSATHPIKLRRDIDRAREADGTAASRPLQRPVARRLHEGARGQLRRASVAAARRTVRLLPSPRLASTQHHTPCISCRRQLAACRETRRRSRKGTSGEGRRCHLIGGGCTAGLLGPRSSGRQR